MAPTNNRGNRGGKTKHMKKGGKTGDEAAAAAKRNLSDMPIPKDFEEYGGGTWIGVVTMCCGGPIYKARPVMESGVAEEIRTVHRLDGKLQDKSGRRFKCPNISVGTLLLCAERTYESKKEKKSDIVYVYNPTDEIPYLKGLEVIHKFYEVFLNPQQMLQELDASKGDTGFDFGEKIDMEKM